jgi:hypothetical protein
MAACRCVQLLVSAVSVAISLDDLVVYVGPNSHFVQYSLRRQSIRAGIAAIIEAQYAPKTVANTIGWGRAPAEARP